MVDYDATIGTTYPCGCFHSAISERYNRECQEHFEKKCVMHALQADDYKRNGFRMPYTVAARKGYMVLFYGL